MIKKGKKEVEGRAMNGKRAKRTRRLKRKRWKREGRRS